MSYSEFKNLAYLKLKLNISHQKSHWFQSSSIQPLQASPLLAEEIAFGLARPMTTEKARSENLISPVIKEIQKKNINKMTYFSGYGLNVDESKGLTGNCDYLFSAKPNILDIESPIFCLVEAKSGVVDEGYAQCGAEMYASLIYNQLYNEVQEIIYGACTNGLEWVFMKLENNILLIDDERILINDLPKILGILQWIIDESV
jgi:hypothetical protein